MKRRPCLLAFPAAGLALITGCGGAGTGAHAGRDAAGRAVRIGAPSTTPTTATAGSSLTPVPSATPSVTTPVPSASAASPSARPASARDRAWLAFAHQTNLAEVAAGGLAEKKGGTAAVRSAGQMLATDHARLDTEVVRVAGGLGVTLPKAPTSEQQEAGRRLAGESGARFDEDFLSTTVAGHQQAIARTRAEIRRGSAPEVTGLARTALPDLVRHLETLRRAQASG